MKSKDMACLSVLLVFFALVRFVFAVPKPRIFVLTDIGNEPFVYPSLFDIPPETRDDTMSVTRFLLYSNQFDVRGICATTSTWLPNQTRIDLLQERILAYEKIYDNLSVHQPDTEGPWPTSEELFSKTYSGSPFYGLEGVGEGHSSNGSIGLRNAVDESEEVTWVTIWGGGNVLAQAVWEYEQNHTQTEIEHFISKLRVYSISDQDDSTPWLRRRYPRIFWIISIHAMNMYGEATWTGISGSVDPGGPNATLVTNEWLQTNIRDVSPFGTGYPIFLYIMEGDTPTFLYLIQNGLGVSERPHWGSWGGRYGRTSKEDTLHVNTDDVDVPGIGGSSFTSQYSTIWRWRDAYQWDFSGRMRWTSTSDFSAVNHNPIVVVNGSKIVSDALYLNVTPGETVFLDASSSYDPDVPSSNATDKNLSDKGFTSVQFWQYVSASLSQQSVTSAPVLSINQTGLTATVQVPELEYIPSAWIQGRGANFEDKTLHVIVEIWDDGTPGLVGYKRVVINVQV